MYLCISEKNNLCCEQSFRAKHLPSAITESISSSKMQHSNLNKATFVTQRRPFVCPQAERKTKYTLCCLSFLSLSPSAASCTVDVTRLFSKPKHVFPLLLIFQICDRKNSPLPRVINPTHVWLRRVSTATEFKSEPTARAFLSRITMVTLENGKKGGCLCSDGQEEGYRKGLSVWQGKQNSSFEIQGAGHTSNFENQHVYTPTWFWTHKTSATRSVSGTFTGLWLWSPYKIWQEVLLATWGLGECLKKARGILHMTVFFPHNLQRAVNSTCDWKSLHRKWTPQGGSLTER